MIQKLRIQAGWLFLCAALIACGGGGGGDASNTDSPGDGSVESDSGEPAGDGGHDGDAGDSGDTDASKGDAGVPDGGDPTGDADATTLTLMSLEITPADPSVAVGATLQFTAMGTFSDDSVQDLTAMATWTSDDEGVAVISNDAGDAGLALANAAGTATISASLAGVTGSTTLAITPPGVVLVSLSIAPSHPTLAAGTQLALRATGVYSDETKQDLTQAVTWASDDEAVASVSNVDGEQGMMQGVAAGQAVISVALDGVGASTAVTVTSATLEAISVEPTHPAIAAGTEQQFVATGHFSDGTAQDLTTQVIWASDDEAVATISNAAGSNGLAAGVSPGVAQISATLNAVTGQTQLTVSAATVSSLTVSPASVSIAAGTTQQFALTATLSDGSVQDLTAQASWSSDAEGIATVSDAAGSKGLATALAAGTATIQASFGGQAATATLNVTSATLERIEVTPESASIAAGTTQKFVATGVFSDASKQDLSKQVIWASSDTTIATISNAGGSEGLASGQTAGSASITASLQDVEGSATLTVTAAVLTSISIAPADAVVAPGTKLQYTASGNFSDGSTQDLTREVAWTSDDTAVATVANGDLNAGLATAVAEGTTTIRAMLDGVTGSTPLTVSDAALESITVSPTDASIAAGATLQFTATGHFSDGSTQDLTGSVAWSANPGSVATISNVPGSKGLAEGEGEGTATITASLDGVEASTSLTVTAAVLSSIAVTPADPSIAAGTNQQFAATGRYSDGSEQDLTQQVTWASDDEAVATISNALITAGLATGHSAGEAVITASYGGMVGATTLTVAEATLVSITVSPDAASIQIGGTQKFMATGAFDDGSEQDLTAQVTWSVADPTVAAISNFGGTKGTATGLKVGETEVLAALDGIEGSATLTVTAVF